MATTIDSSPPRSRANLCTRPAASKCPFSRPYRAPHEGLAESSETRHYQFDCVLALTLKTAVNAARQSRNQSCRRAGCRLQVESCRLASNALGQLATSSQPANNLDYCSAARPSRNRRQTRLNAETRRTRRNAEAKNSLHCNSRGEEVPMNSPAELHGQYGPLYPTLSPSEGEWERERGPTSSPRSTPTQPYGSGVLSLIAAR